jgi:hypothetical protein
MPEAPAPDSSTPEPEWTARLEALGRELGEREAEHGPALERARSCAEALRGTVSRALERFHAAASAAGAPHLEIEVSPVRTDDKHLRAVEFNLVRGRHKAVVVAKARGDVTLVGPFHVGKNEGPCKSFPMDADAEIQQALGELLARFVEEAAAP